MQKNDVVYILKNDIQPDELRYSLRSVAANFPYRKVWFYGGCPEGIRPDVMVEVDQVGKTKWEKVSWTLRKVCENDDITEDFWLFNDDFFIMKPVKEFPPAVRGTLRKRVDGIIAKYGHVTKYSRRLREAEEALRKRGYDTLDYALHMPILVNRAKAIECLDTFPDQPMFRSLYGNFARIGGVITDDVKINTTDKEPTGDEIMLSTGDNSFREGKVGEHIRKRFKEPCQYESV